MINLFRVYREENKDGAGSGGGGPGDGAGGDKGGTGEAAGLLAAKAASDAAAAAAAAKAAAGGMGEKPARPDTVPEQFWDAEKGQPRIDSLAKSWADTNKALRELQGKQGLKPPEKAEDYKFELPKDMKLPVEIKADDPALNAFRQVAHKMGMSQDQFQAGVSAMLEATKDFMPAAVDMAAEMKTLGPNGDAMIGAVHAWGKNLVDSGLWSQAEFEEVIYMGSTAQGILALNKLREHMGEKPIPTTGVIQEGAPSKDELYAMVNDPRYGNDEAYTKEVTAKFQQVYGTGPAGSSEAGRGVPRGTSTPGFADLRKTG